MTQRRSAKARPARSARPKRRVVSKPRKLSPKLQITIDRLVDAANQALLLNPGAQTSPQDRKDNLFKQAVYSEVRRLISTGRDAEIRQIVEHGSGQPRSIEFAVNPFHWALFAMSKSGNLERDFTPNSLNSLAWQLLHAHRHDIPPGLLTGFLFQTAASSLEKQKLIKAPGNVHLEAWFSALQKR